MNKKILMTGGVQLASRALNIITGVYIARELGPSLFGVYGLIVSIITILLIPISKGFPQLIIRELSYAEKLKDYSKFNSVISFGNRYVVGVLLFICTMIFILNKLSVFGELNNQILIILILYTIMKGVVTFENSILTSMRKPQLAQLATGVVPFVLAFMFFLLLDIKDVTLNLNYIYIGLFIGWAISFVLFFLVIRKLVPNSQEEKYYSEGYLSKLLPLLMIGGLGVFFSEAPYLVIGPNLPPSDLGIYKVAVQVSSLVSMGLAIVNMVVGAELARAFRGEDADLAQEIINHAVRVASLFALSVVLFIYLVGETLIIKVFGSRYLSSSELMNLLLIGQIFNAVTGPAGLALTMSGNERFLLKVNVVLIVLYVPLLFLLINIFGIYGAALGTLIITIISNFSCVLIVKQKLGLKTWVFA